MPRVLVADDNSNIQKMVALALEERGIDVVSVGNGEAAVRRIPDLAPDLVLADVFMPVRNGYEVCEFVKTNEKFSHVPVILLVGAFDPLDEKEARRVGADGVLKKPFVPPDPLIAMVTSALEKNPKAAPEPAQGPAGPPRPDPSPALQGSVRPAPKPLPEFPPAGDDDLPVYGFEKANEKRADTDFSPRFSSPEMQASEEDFDSSVTATDWRRNAANFEIPEDLNSRMAVTPNEGFHSAVFPSEHDIPPTRTPLTDEKDAQETTEVHRAEEEEESFPPTTERYAEPAPAPSTGEEAFARPVAVEAPSESAARPEAIAPSQTIAPAAGAHEPEPASHESPAAPAASETLPSPSVYAEDGWMSTLLAKYRRSKPDHEEAKLQSKDGQTAESPSVAEAPQSAPAESTPLVAQSEEPKYPSEEKGDTVFPPAAPTAESWFAPHPEDVAQLQSWPDPEASRFSAETEANLMASPADVNDEERSHFVAGFESSPTPEESAANSGGFDLASLAPELQAEDDADHNGPASSFFAPSNHEDLLDRDSASHPGGHQESLHPSAAVDLATHADASTSIFASPMSSAPAPPSPDVPGHSEEFPERVPTARPASREALADIPFLTPPPPAPFEHVASEGRASAAVEAGSDAPSVDAVVNRLLERLEPRLHEMLAKDLLKPLVENLLRDELAKPSK